MDAVAGAAAGAVAEAVAGAVAVAADDAVSVGAAASWPSGAGTVIGKVAAARVAGIVAASAAAPARAGSEPDRVTQQPPSKVGDGHLSMRTIRITLPPMPTFPATPTPAPTPRRPAAAQAPAADAALPARHGAHRGAVARIAAAALFGGAQEVEIQHGEAVYRLRITSMGKLILTK